ncbi:hypothetical protein FRC01_010954 [Tulasnella sp. 417]|nr:hypothetical protein FRC01_010954 [Tulasnella sp. 417]
MNEGSTAKDQDLSLCFAASGDLRNIIKTVNGLPQDYRGQLKLVINDFHSQVAIRNVVLLCMLLDQSGPSEELTAEVVLHALYSAKLTTSQASFVQSWIDRINSMDRGSPYLFDGQMEFGSRCDLRWWFPGEVAAQAHKKLLYSEDGEWLLKDNASPATAWDPLEVNKTRQKLKLPEEDYMGNLFFHIKHELVEFIKRVRRFNLKVFLFSMDLLVLPEFLDIMSKETGKITFDRVETSNVMDTVGPSAILSSWGPRLNRDNPHSCLLMYSMNWAMRIPGGHVESLGRDKVEKTMAQVFDYLGFKRGMKLDKVPPLGQATTNLGAFHDTRPSFARYLRENGVQEACRALGVRERKVPRILPPRIGVGLKDFDSPKITITLEQFYWTGCIQYPTWHERFLEFEAA